MEKYKSIFISDVHLGSKGCKSKYLNNFLKSNSCENLFLVGDIIDCWRLKSKIYWPQEHSDVINNVLSMAKYGTRVNYITGNHDDFLRIYQPLQLGNLELKEEHIYETISGKKFLIIHGDQFDIVTKYGKSLSVLGDKVYTFLLALNKVLNFFRSRLGFGYWSLAKYLKDLTKKAVNKASDYEESLSRECKTRNLDGIVCGHIHRAQISVINGIDYLNCGDWVESASALVETMKGEFKLIKWGDIEKARENIKLLSNSS